MNIPLIIATLQEITNHNTTFSLDSYENPKCRETLLNIRSIVNDLSYDTNTGKLYFESFSITDKEQEAILLESLEELHSIINEMNIAYCSEMNAHRPPINHSKELMSQAITPFFEQRYGISVMPEFSRQEQQHIPNLLTCQSRIDNREAGEHETTLNHSGIYMRNYTSINLRRGNLHIFNGHADNNELAHRIHDMSGITPRGGDLFPMICFQGREKITSLLRYLHRNRPTTDTGVIHLERSEYLSSVSLGEEERGIILCGESKLETTDRRPANPFMRTTLQGTAPLAEGTWVYNTTGRTQVSLQRSSSGNRLYLGQHANFFENRNRLLNKQFRNILQSLQGAAPLKTHHYQIDFDFNHVTPKIGEVDIINFFYSLQSPENYEHFHKQFVNPETQNIDYDKLNLLFINPKEYHKKYTPEEIFVPVDERACIWINFSKKQNQSESQMNTNNFAERMSHRTIERSELATRAERQKLPSSTTRKDKLKRSHSFS